LGLYFQGLEKEQTEKSPRLDELNKTGQILLDQMGKGETLFFFPQDFLDSDLE
jgi:hypothetical protein